MNSDRTIIFNIPQDQRDIKYLPSFLFPVQAWLMFWKLRATMCNIKHQSIYNIIRWVAGMMGQRNRRPSVWCSKYFFFHDFLQNSLQKSFQFFFLIFFKKTSKIKIKSFECPKSIKSINKKYLEHQTLGRRFVCPIVQATQHNIL